VFSVWPIETDTGFTRNAALVFFYLIKLGYWFTSASQVKDGYIFRGINDNAFTKKANDLNANLITAFYSVPMLFELRTILQWMCVNSSLDWKDSFLMEDIYFKVFLAKCDLTEEEPRVRGTTIKFRERCKIGGCLVFLVMLLLLGPLLLFSDINPAETRNNVTAARLSLTFDGLLGDFQVISISSLTELGVVDSSEYVSLTTSGVISDNVRPITVQNVRLAPYSDSVWTITQPGLADFISSLQDVSSPLTVSCQATFTRPGPSGNEQISITTEIELSNTERLAFAEDIVNTQNVSATLNLTGLIPQFLQLPGTSEVNILQDYDSVTYSLQVVETDELYYWLLTNSTNSSDGVLFVTQSDPIFESALSSGEGGYGIVTFYVAVVFTIANFIRLSTSDQTYTLVYDKMLNVDDLLILCEAVYISRYTKDFKREETLFRILVRVFRSPEMILKLTKRKIKQD